MRLTIKIYSENDISPTFAFDIIYRPTHKMLDSSLDGNFLLHPIGGRILYANAN